MDLKQKKIIFWSVVITLFISIFTFFFIDVEYYKNDDIRDRIGISILRTFFLIYPPSIIIWRVFFGKINYRIRYIGSLRLFIYISKILMYVAFIMIYIRGFIIKVSDLISEHSWGITNILIILILSFVIHLIFKKFIFNFIKGEE